MSYGLRPMESTIIECIPPLKVAINGIPRMWTHLLHTCHNNHEDACLACGYRDCPKHCPSHYNKRGCPSCDLKVDTVGV